MPIHNSDISRVADKIFAHTRAIEVPFYNRERSKAEIQQLFSNLDALRGSAVIVSSPMGTGKTFFIDTVAPSLGISGHAKRLLVKEVTDRELNQVRGDVLFVDEGDIKSDWQDLARGMKIFGQHLKDSERVGLLLGDFIMRNPMLLRFLPRSRFMGQFELIDRSFLQGVIRQRIRYELGVDRGETIIEPELYDVLVPDGMEQVTSFRGVFSFLQGMAGEDFLPNNHDTCKFTLQMAKEYVVEELDLVFWTSRQSDFFNLFLNLLETRFPRGSGLTNGFGKDELLILGHQVGYQDWESFESEIIEPLGIESLLLARGTPGLDDQGHYVRWVEPYYPSLRLMLLAEA